MFVCSKKEAILDLLYGEGVSPEELHFLRSHISGCANCSAELADLSFARSEVSKYVELCLSPLDSPPINWRPETARQREALASAAKLFDGRLFELLPRFAFASIFLLAVLAATVLLIYRQPADTGPVAVVLDPPVNADLQKNVRDGVSVLRPAPTVSANDPESAEAVKADQRDKKIIHQRTKGRLSPQPRPRVVTASPEIRKRPSQFDAFDEFADESLRLSDILEQIGG